MICSSSWLAFLLNQVDESWVELVDVEPISYEAFFQLREIWICFLFPAHVFLFRFQMGEVDFTAEAGCAAKVPS